MSIFRRKPRSAAGRTDPTEVTEHSPAPPPPVPVPEPPLPVPVPTPPLPVPVPGLSPVPETGAVRTGGGTGSLILGGGRQGQQGSDVK